MKKKKANINKIYTEKNLNYNQNVHSKTSNRTRDGLKWENTCPASARPCFQTPVTPERKTSNSYLFKVMLKDILKTTIFCNYFSDVS
jgi:hypothetical protein